MARLPQPGSDVGNWGDILNDYLTTSHNADGSLKNIPQNRVINLATDIAEKADAAATLDALNLKAPLDSPTFTGTVFGISPTMTGAEPAGLSATTQASLNASYAEPGYWADDLLSVMGRLTPPVNTPTINHANGSTSQLTGPVEYSPNGVGGGSAVANWDGKNNTSFAIHPGLFYTANGGNNDLALYGYNKGGVVGATWPMVFEFTTSVVVDRVEIGWYGSTAPSFRLEINGHPAIGDYVLDGPSGFGNGKTSLLIFPTAGARRIRIYASGGTGLRAIRVNTGGAISKPADTERIGVWIGDSYANGAGSASTFPAGAGSFDTFALRVLKALGCNRFVLAGIGGRGFTTAGQPFIDRVADVLPLGPHVLAVNGSINDGSSAGGIQAAVDAFLAASSSIPERYVVGTMLAPYGPNHDAVKAAADAAGVPFVDMKDFIYGTGYVTAPTGDGNRDILLGDIGGPHPTQQGHAAIARKIISTISRLREAN